MHGNRFRQDLSRRGFGAALASLTAVGAAADPLAQGPSTAPPTALDGALVATGADDAGRITVPVRVNGQGPFRFVVDTGANRTVISSELAAALALPAGGAADIHGIVGVEPAQTALIDRLDVDAVSARAIRAPMLSRDRLGAAGLLGVDVLRRHRVSFDFVHRQLRLRSASLAPDRSTLYDDTSNSGRLIQMSGAKVVVPAQYRFGQLIIIGADVSGQRVTAFVDSGSQSTVGNNALRRVASVEGAGAPKAVRQMTPILSATGQTAQGEVSRMPLLKIGGLAITGLATVFADLHVFQLWDLMKQPSLLLGMDILSLFDGIELNYAQRQVIFYLPLRARSS